MRLSILSLILLESLYVSATALNKSASASSNPRSALDERTVGGIFLCEDINWGEPCGYAVQPLYTCINLGDDWNNLISSFGPDEGTQCRLYDNAGCDRNNGRFLDLAWPGSDDMTQVWGVNFNDITSSFECQPTGTAFDCEYFAPYESYSTIIDCFKCPSPSTCSGTCGSCTPVQT